MIVKYTKCRILQNFWLFQRVKSAQRQKFFFMTGVVNRFIRIGLATCFTACLEGRPLGLVLLKGLRFNLAEVDHVGRQSSLINRTGPSSSQILFWVAPLSPGIDKSPAVSRQVQLVVQSIRNKRTELTRQSAHVQ